MPKIDAIKKVLRIEQDAWVPRAIDPEDDEEFRICHNVSFECGELVSDSVPHRPEFVNSDRTHDRDA